MPAGASAEPPSRWIRSDPTVVWLDQVRSRTRIVSNEGAASESIPVSQSFALALGESSVRGTFPNLPRRLLLDRARSLIRLDEARARVGAHNAGSGAGVVIGVIDSGIDANHPDLIAADGTSRLAWWLDFGERPLGFHPELERDYGCNSGALQCGILGPEEIQRLVEGRELTGSLGRGARLPSDRLGHGTHVASLALGNGRADPAFAGVAPQATLIGARVATSGAQVEDQDIMLAARFVFERARELGMPAVLNLSLGGDMGPHDGTSALEQALGELVSGQGGRVVVVATGNSGGLETGEGPYPRPLGIHTDVHVPRDSTVRVPILIPSEPAGAAAVFAWIAMQPGDELSVAVEDQAGQRALPFTRRGEAASATNGEIDIALVHHVESDEGVADTEHGIALILSGALRGGSVFSLLLEGSATVDLWLQSEGGLAPEAGRGGAVFPAATRERTATLPATSPEVIAVGAVLNRTRWTSFGEAVELLPFDEQLELAVGSALYFSSAGPNLLGHTKPDLVAPGGVVAGALARGAEATRDGRVNASSIFGLTPLCDGASCAQLDDTHGVTLGTSMAAPLVSGAAALLLERDPTLRHDEVRRLLQAGAARSDGFEPQTGAGLLDVERAFEALEFTGQPNRSPPSARRSWLSFAQSFARPGAERPLGALLHLRDDEGRLTDVAPSELAVTLRHASLRGEPTRQAPGLYALSLDADPDAAFEMLHIEVRSGGRLIARRDLPIHVDSATAARGVSVRGGCDVLGAAGAAFWPLFPLALLALSVRRRWFWHA